MWTSVFNMANTHLVVSACVKKWRHLFWGCVLFCPEHVAKVDYLVDQVLVHLVLLVGIGQKIMCTGCWQLSQMPTKLVCVCTGRYDESLGAHTKLRTEFAEQPKLTAFKESRSHERHLHFAMRSVNGNLWP